ncbi:MAG: hypothetical protein ABI321_05740, partial [Polyangia bacterium]
SCQDHSCVAPVVCGAANCNGCCDDTDTCQPGTADANCGTSGGRCATCTGATCTGGVCEMPCGPGNCTGCCDGTGTCVASVPSSCGINGATCKQCDTSDLCSDGACIGTTCKSTCPGCCAGNTCELGNTVAQCGTTGNACGACPSTQVCSNGACAVDPNSLWDFLVFTGEAPLYENPPTNDSTWDPFGGLPDPYMELDLSYGQADQSITYSPAVSNTITPNYMGAKLVSGVKASLLFESSYLQMWDSDGFAVPAGADDDMGFCPFKLTQAMFDGNLRSSTCSPAYGNSVGVTWKINWKIVPHT